MADSPTICVTLGRERLHDLLVDHRRLVADGVRLVEWRLDWLTEPIDLAELFAKQPGPVIVTLRRPEDGGRFEGDEDGRLKLLREAMQAGADYVDLEEHAAAKIPRLGTARRIVSLHDFSGTPADLPALHARLAALDADVVKLATRANSTHDNTRMLRLVRDSRLPTVGLCMGELGSPTRVLALRCGAPFSFAATGAGAPLAPGQLSFRDMRSLYRCEQLSPATEVYGVIGAPIGHSRSPLVHNPAMNHLGLDKVYLPFLVPPDDLPSFLDDAPELGIKGLSVTIPHKESILASITDMDPAVRAIGAANTLVWKDSRIYAYNTDQQAALDSLAAATGQTTAEFRGRSALVLGAGGAAKAIVHGLRQSGAEVIVTSRTIERAEELAKAMGCRAIRWEDRHDGRPNLIVNCTPLGMSPHVNATPFEAGALKPGMIVFDTVYNPEQTRLLMQAQAAGCTVVSGLEMFLRQAARQFELFTGHEAPWQIMRDALRQSQNPGA